MVFFAATITLGASRIDDCKKHEHGLIFVLGLVQEFEKDIKNPFVKNTLIVWNEAQRTLGEVPALSYFAPIWGNKDFSPGKNYSGFKHWALKGIQKIGDLFEGDMLMPFNKLRDKFGNPKTHFFKYLQVRSYIRIKQHYSMSIPLLTGLEQIMFNEELSTNNITLLYCKFVNSSKESSESKRVAWGTDLQYDFSDSEWSEVCARAQNLSINTRFKLLQYN